jgi:hypothetical protein
MEDEEKKQETIAAENDKIQAEKDRSTSEKLTLHQKINDLE